MKGWKTVLFGVLIAATGALATPEMQAFVAEHLPVVSGSLGAVIIGLRWLTNSSIFKKE